MTMFVHDLPVLYPSKIWSIRGSSVRLAAHRSTRASDDAFEIGEIEAVNAVNPKDKYEDLKTQTRECG